MSQTKNEFHIAFSFDRSFIQQAYVLVTSILSNSSSSLSFFCITDCTDSERNELANYISREGSSLTFLQVSPAVFDGLEKTIQSHWSISVYFKLMFPLLVPKHVEQLLYLDCDIIVLGDLSSIFNHSDNTLPVAGVYDNYVKHQPLIGIEDEAHYMNSGVMLINVAVWNHRKITERALDFARLHPNNILFVDQDAVNAILLGDWYRLPERYNFMTSYLPNPTSKQDLNRLASEVVVIHFTLQKPWKLDCTNRFRIYYDKYFKQSPKKNSRYQDISFQQVWSKCKLTAIEYYNDTRWVQLIWRKIKRSL